ncbi:MAG: TetR/AcrR family transcriptional regulator [Fibrobacteria bacterium]|nr:TetR/AcrR family transcriptional regulator [Fibrobacteria bacterium]
MALSPLDILDKSSALFELRGYHGTSMADISTACGLTKPALYHHFRDKEHLFLALLEAGLQDLESQLERLETSIPERPSDVLGDLLEILCAPPGRARVAMRLASQDLSHLSESARETFGAAYRQRFPSRVARLVAGLPLRTDLDPSLATTALLGMASAFSRRHRPPGTARTLANLFLEGCLAREP